MSVRRVKIVIDTESLTQQNVAPNVYMLAPSDMSPTGQGGNELGITVSQGDQVIWSAGGFDPGVVVKLIAAQSPGALVTNMTTDYNDDGSVTGSANTACNQAIYRFSFTINDVDFTQYTWDPYITIVG